MIIDGKHIGDECYVIAEIGHNHGGSLQTALEMIKVAKECGADAVKFQKRDNKTLYTKELYDSPYVNENSYGKTYGEHREALEFNDEYHKLQIYSKEIGITMFATAFDFKSADFLFDLGVPAFKIASGDLTNTPLLEYVAHFQKPMIVSTGGGTITDVVRAYSTIMPINSQLCFMQCTCSYPCDFKEMNLNVVKTYREIFPGIVVGLSAHDSGIAMSLVGYMLGARIIEKHFTLNRASKGTDHAFSLEPQGLRKLVRDLKRAHLALGDGIKQFYASESNGLRKMGKKLVVSSDLPIGHTLTYDDIAIKSPNDGLPPYEISNVIGKNTLRALKEDENVTFEDLVDG